MKLPHREIGRISDHHLRGMGTVTREMVTERAREIALINGHDPSHFLQDDWLAAKRDLLGVDTAHEVDDATEEKDLHWGFEPGSKGHIHEELEPNDDQTVAERLIQEGVDEANHEQMVEGSRSGNLQG